MKRILIFSLSYYPRFVGGAEVANKEITDRISPDDIEFHMVTLRYDSTLLRVEKIGNVLVHRIGFSRPSPTIADLKKFPLRLNKFFFQFTAALEASSLHKKYHYDAVWAMMVHSCGVPASIFKSRNPHVPYILTLQEGDPPEQIEKTMRPLWSLFVRAFKKADIVQAISTFLGNWALRRGFSGPLEIIPNGVDVERFSKDISQDERAKLEEKLVRQPGDVYLITVSRLVQKNAVDDCIRALALLPKHIRLLVAGIGPDEEKLQQLARDLRVAEHVRFLGQIDNADVPNYLHISDIFIRPSRSEGMGNAFVEAFAAGIPVIATQEGGIADLLFDAQRNRDRPTTGWAVDKNSPKDIAGMVMNILTNPERVIRVIKNAHALAVEKYDWDLVAKAMREKVFGKVFK